MEKIRYVSLLEPELEILEIPTEFEDNALPIWKKILEKATILNKELPKYRCLHIIGRAGCKEFKICRGSKCKGFMPVWAATS